MAKNLVSGPILVPLVQIWSQNIFRGFYLYQMLQATTVYNFKDN